MKTTLAMMTMGLLGLAGGDAAAAEPTHTMTALEARVEPGTQVDIVDRQGRILRGDFVRADDEGVLVTVYGSAEGRRVGAAEVLSITRAGDSLKNGVLIGAAVGGLTALAVSTDDTGASGCFSTSCKAGLSAFAVVTYAGIGALIDRMIKGHEVVYRAPTDRVSWSVVPHPVPRGGGLLLALRF